MAVEVETAWRPCQHTIPPTCGRPADYEVVDTGTLIRFYLCRKHLDLFLKKMDREMWRHRLEIRRDGRLLAAGLPRELLGMRW